MCTQTRQELALSAISVENLIVYESSDLESIILADLGDWTHLILASEEQKVTLQDGRMVFVIVQYIGEECAIFDENDPLIEEKLNFKIELVKILCYADSK